MLTIITCNSCKKSGRLPYQLHIEFNHKNCKTCGNETHSGRMYYFCSERCLRKFMKQKDIIKKEAWEK